MTHGAWTRWCGPDDWRPNIWMTAWRASIGTHATSWVLTSFAQNAASLALARRLRERYPHLTIVFGGANCEGEMGLQLHRSFSWIDFVCGGEADVSFPLLMDRLRSGGDVHGIPGVISRRDGESIYSDLSPEPVRDMDALPFPDYDDYFEQLAAMNLKPGVPWVLMETSRGCWWGEKSHCTFCGLNGLSMTYRAKSRDRALQEILYLTERYQTPYLEMVDNILDMRYFRDLLPELKRRRIHLDSLQTKANLTKDQVQLMRDAGVTQIQPGIESFGTNVLRLMGKGTEHDAKHPASQVVQGVWHQGSLESSLRLPR